MEKTKLVHCTVCICNIYIYMLIMYDRPPNYPSSMKTCSLPGVLQKFQKHGKTKHGSCFVTASTCQLPTNFRNWWLWLWLKIIETDDWHFCRHVAAGIWWPFGYGSNFLNPQNKIRWLRIQSSSSQFCCSKVLPHFEPHTHNPPKELTALPLKKNEPTKKSQKESFHPLRKGA